MTPESGIMSSFQLYQQRLSNLPTVLEQLFQIVENDEALKFMKDQNLVKYKIDRVNELVLQVLNSEKEQMLIQVLQKYHQIEKKLEEKQQNCCVPSKEQEKNTFVKEKTQQRSSKLQIQIETLLKEIDSKNEKILYLNNQLQEKNQKIFDLIEENQSFQKVEEQIKVKDMKLQEAMRAVMKLKKDGEEAVEELKKENKYLTTDKQELERGKISLQYEVTMLKEEMDKKSLKQCQNSRKERIQVLNQQVKFLEEQLMYVQKSFAIIKDRVLFGILSEIKNLKKLYNNFKTHIRRAHEQYRRQIEEVWEENKQHLPLKRNQDINPEVLLKKVSLLNMELDNFLEKEIPI